MNLDHLRYFVTTSETLHTAKAAKIMNVSQSTICHGIAKLEQELGCDLFENVGKRIVLTDLGKRFAKRANEFLSQADRLQDEFRTSDLPIDAQIRVGVVHGVGARSVAPLLAKIQVDNPGLLFEFYSLRSAQVIDGLITKSIDVGICFSPTSHPEVTELNAIHTPLKIAVRNSHPALKVRKKVSAKDVLLYSCASPKAFAGIEVCEDHPALKRNGIRTNPSFIFDSYEIAAAYLRSSDAWCLMPDILIAPLGLKVLPFKDLEASSKLSLLVPKGRHLPKKVEESLQTLFE